MGLQVRKKYIKTAVGGQFNKIPASNNPIESMRPVKNMNITKAPSGTRLLSNSLIYVQHCHQAYAAY